MVLLILVTKILIIAWLITLFHSSVGLFLTPNIAFLSSCCSRFIQQPQNIFIFSMIHIRKRLIHRFSLTPLNDWFNELFHFFFKIEYLYIVNVHCLYNWHSCNIIGLNFPELQNQVSTAEAINVNVSWLQTHLEAFHKRMKGVEVRCGSTQSCKKKAKWQFVGINLSNYILKRRVTINCIWLNNWCVWGIVIEVRCRMTWLFSRDHERASWIYGQLLIHNVTKTLSNVSTYSTVYQVSFVFV